MGQDSSYFKKIQSHIFNFLHLKISDSYKTKDLLGPLKHLISPIHTIEPPNKANQVQPPEARHSKASKSSQKSLSHPPTLWGIPLSIKRQPYVRFLRFFVSPNGQIQITAPLKSQFSDIEKELSEYKEWILKCCKEQEALRSLFPVKKFINGESFEYLGESFTLKIESALLKKPIIQFDLHFDLDFISLLYPQDWDLKPHKDKEGLLKKTLNQFYKEQAITFLNQRLRTLSQSTGLFPKKVSYRSQKTRWGSCSTTSSITLNWKLIVFKTEVIDYVILHELSHLKHPNHGPRFWVLVEKHCPEYKRLRKELNQNQFCTDFLSPQSDLYSSNPSL